MTVGQLKQVLTMLSDSVPIFVAWGPDLGAVVYWRYEASGEGQNEESGEMRGTLGGKLILKTTRESQTAIGQLR